MKSLRSGLILSLLAGITLLLAATGALIYFITFAQLHSEVNRSLAGIAKSVAPAILRHAERADPSASEPVSEARGLREADPNFLTSLPFQCWAPDGRVITKSVNLGAHVLPRIASGLQPVPVESFDEDRLVFRPVTLPDETPGCAVGLCLVAPAQAGRGAGQPVVELVVAQDMAEVADTLAKLRWLLILGWALTSLCTAGIVSWVVNRRLRPVDALRDQMGRMDPASLGQGVVLNEPPAELAPVVGQLNDLLLRLHEAFDREQAFTSDAAHELRTPLTGLRSTLELALSRERDSAELRGAASRCLEITLQMQTMVESLLELARASALQSARTRETVSAAELIRECWEPYARRRERRGLELELDVRSGLTVTTDLELFRHVLRNLFENSVAHADAGSRIAIRARRENGDFLLTLTNAARSAPLKPRKDARAAVGHLGLGLSLCRRIVETLGGHIETDAEGGEFAVTLTLPAGADG